MHQTLSEMQYLFQPQTQSIAEILLLSLFKDKETEVQRDYEFNGFAQEYITNISVNLDSK